MAYALTDPTTVLSRTSGLIAASEDYTCIVTVRILAGVTGSNYRTAVVFKNADYSQYVGIFTAPSGNAFALEIYDGVTEGVSATVAATVDQSLAVAYIRKGTSHYLYKRDGGNNGLLLIGGIFSYDVSGFTFTDVQLGNDEASETNMEVSYFREWARALTNNELLLELNGSLSGGAPDLATDTPLLANLTDLSGHGHSWTVLGVAGAFVNDIPSTPIIITAETFPFTRTVTMAEFNVANEIWFQYTSSVQPVWIGMGRNSDLSQTLRSSIFLSDALSTIISTTAGSLSAPVTTGTYYWHLRRNAGGAIAADFTVTFELLAIVDELPGCTFIINNDLPGYGAYTFNAVTGAPTGMVNQLPAGEQAAVLPNGVSLWHDRYLNYHAESLVVLGTDLALIASVDTVPPIGTGDASDNNACLTANTTDFYVLRVADNKLWKVTAAGVITDTGNTIVPNASDVRSIGVNPAGTRLYWTEGTSAPYVVYKWDLTTNTEDTHLYATDIAAGYIGITGFNANNGDILVLPDGSTVVNGKKNTDAFTTIYWISAAGVLLDQYFTTGEFYLVNHMAYSGSGTTVYLWLFNDDAILGKIVILDLAGDTFTEVLNSPMFSGGVSQDPVGTQAIGVPVSCSALVYQYETCPWSPTPPPEPSPFLGFQTELPIRWVLRTPVIP